MPTLLHTFAAGTLAVMLAGCQADPTPAAATSSQTTRTDSPAPAVPASAAQGTASLLAAAGITCPQASPGPDSTGCSAGLADNGKPYEVQLQATCGDDGFFAAVLQTGGASLLPRLPTQPGSADEHGALLSDNQFVCIQAIARQGQAVAYYRVQAMDPAEVAACRGDATCDQHRPPAGAACTVATPQGCASGWVKADTLEVFSNGIGSTQDQAPPATPAQWALVDSVRSDDGRFQLQVLEQPDNRQAPRRVVLQAVHSDGRVQELARNDRLVPCAGCGGLAGDPYAYSRFDDRGLDIVIGAGAPTAVGNALTKASPGRWNG